MPRPSRPGYFMDVKSAARFLSAWVIWIMLTLEAAAAPAAKGAKRGAELDGEKVGWDLRVLREARLTPQDARVLLRRMEEEVEPNLQPATCMTIIQALAAGGHRDEAWAFIPEAAEHPQRLSALAGFFSCGRFRKQAEVLGFLERLQTPSERGVAASRLFAVQPELAMGLEPWVVPGRSTMEQALFVNAAETLIANQAEPRVKLVRFLLERAADGYLPAEGLLRIMASAGDAAAGGQWDCLETMASSFTPTLLEELRADFAGRLARVRMAEAWQRVEALPAADRNERIWRALVLETGLKSPQQAHKRVEESHAAAPPKLRQALLCGAARAAAGYHQMEQARAWAKRIEAPIPRRLLLEELERLAGNMPAD